MWARLVPMFCVGDALHEALPRIRRQESPLLYSKPLSPFARLRSDSQNTNTSVNTELYQQYSLPRTFVL